MNKQFITFPEYQAHVAVLCRDITLSGWVPDIIVGITRGGCLAATMISQYFNKPCSMLNVSLREFPEINVSDGALSSDAYGDPETGIKPKNILIVDDINDTGATFGWIKIDWGLPCFDGDTAWDAIWHNNVNFAVIVDNLSSNATVDFCSFEINKAETDVWISFPYEEWWSK